MRAFLVLAFFAMIAPSFALDWSFEAHPQPTWLEQSPQERAYVDEKMFDDEGYLNCIAERDAQFKVYSDRYPDFAHSGSTDSRKTAWLDHVLTANTNFNTHCVLDATFLELLARTAQLKDEDFFFCGKLSRPPHTKLEQQLDRLVTQAFHFVGLEEDERAVAPLRHHKRGSFIELHPDLLYFYRAQYGPFDEIDEIAWGESTFYPNHTISPNRKTELDQAIEAGDVQRVIDTMGDCFRLS